MAEIPLIGQNKTVQTEPEKEPEIIEAETAFLIFISKDVNGIPRVLLSTDIDAAIAPEHKATMDEVLAAIHVVSSDIQAGKNAEMLMLKQQMMARQMMEAQQNQKIMESLQHGQPTPR